MNQPILARKTTRRVGSGLSMGGLVMVCVCFFLPFFRSCEETVIPAEASADEILLLGNPFLLAFALAGLLAIFLMVRQRRWRRVVGVVFGVLCGLALVGNSFPIGYYVLYQYRLHQTWLLHAMILLNGGLLGGGVWFVLRRRAWRWRTAVAWSGLAVCLLATAYFLAWEWHAARHHITFGMNWTGGIAITIRSFQITEALPGMHLTVAAFAAATTGFCLQLLHHRAARRHTLTRWHNSRLRAYHNSPME